MSNVKLMVVWFSLLTESLVQIITLCCPSAHVTVVMFTHDAKVVFVDNESFEYQHESKFVSIVV